ncbi:hypothetical protein AB1Y20_011781 [Prymnesium parvum]|uniref:Uncharacterized protein n=1 Tax=Prymnesium parvum TaxID=97485 RepID=A0AB34IJC6_PRYPA|mmetsp:Transcript_19981/g.49840  ORF Transcript_19981/g.49840 Transcript_19981/m.49840 type:complete len:357 (+) Transcript_19981:77-1147(+)
MLCSPNDERRPVLRYKGSLDGGPSNDHLFHTLLASRASSSTASKPEQPAQRERDERVALLEEEQRAAAADRKDVAAQLVSIARGHARLEERLDEVEARASSVRVMLERRLDQSDSSAKEVVDALSDIRQMMREANDKMAAEKAEYASFFGVLRSLARNASLSLMKHKATIAVVVLLVLGRRFEAESATVASVVKGGLAIIDGFIASVGPTLCMAVMSVFGAVLRSAVARDAPPEVAAASSGGAACAASGQPSKKQAVLYDSGCTALLTNNTHGQVGERRTVSGREFATANGKVAMNTVGGEVHEVRHLLSPRDADAGPRLRPERGCLGGGARVAREPIPSDAARRQGGASRVLRRL